MTVCQNTEKPKIQYTKFHSIRRAVNVVLFFLFVSNAIFVPADPFELKKIAMLLLLVLNCDCFFRMRTKDEWLVCLLGGILTTGTIMISIVWTGNISANVSL